MKNPFSRSNKKSSGTDASTNNHDDQHSRPNTNSNFNNNNNHDGAIIKKRHLPDITKVQVTSRDPLSAKELKMDLQRLVQSTIQTKVMTVTIDTIVATATSVSRQQDLFRLLCRGEERELVAVLGTEEKPIPTKEPSDDNVRFWASTLVAFVATEAHSKLAASYLGVSKQHSVAATVAELEQELEWFFARYDPRHLHFARTIASHFHNNTSMQTGLARFLFQDLLWVALGVSKEQHAYFPYLQTVDAALGLGTVDKLHQSYVDMIAWNQERNEQVRKQAQENVIQGKKSGGKADKDEKEKEKEKSEEDKKLDDSEDKDKEKGEEKDSSKPSAEPADSTDKSNDDDKKKQDDGNEANTKTEETANHDNSSPPSMNNRARTSSIVSTTNNSVNNNKNAVAAESLLWNKQATAAVILVAEFALRQQRHHASAVYASLPPLYRESFGWLAHPWLEIPLDFKMFPKPFILFDLWALDTIHRFTEFRQFCIDQLQSFLLEESGAFTVIEDARRSSEQVLRRKAGVQFIVVRRALEMLVQTETEHRITLETKRSNFLQEAKRSMVYAGEYRELREHNMFNPVNPAFHSKFHAMKLIIEENSREIQRIGRAVGEKQRLQIEATKRQEQMKQFAGTNRNPHHSNSSSNGKTSGQQNASHAVSRQQAAANFLKSSTAMKRIIADEKQHRRHVLQTLGDMDEEERDLTMRLRHHTHLVDVSELMPDDAEEENNNNNESSSSTNSKRQKQNSSQKTNKMVMSASGYTERDAERREQSPSQSGGDQHHHLSPLLSASTSTSLSPSQQRRRQHQLYQKENEKRILIDDEELGKVLYSHEYHVNNTYRYHHHHRDPSSRVMMNNDDDDTNNNNNDDDDYELSLQKEKQRIQKRKSFLTSQQEQQNHHQSPRSLSNPVSTSRRRHSSSIISASGVSPALSRSINSFSPITNNNTSSNNSHHYTTASSTAERIQLEKEKIKRHEKRAVTPTLWNTDTKSRVARVGTPRNNEQIRTGALGRKRDASQAVINSSYKFNTRFSDNNTNAKKNKLHGLDLKNMTNDELAAALEGDGRLRLDTLKKTEDFRNLRNQFFHMMYGRLYEAMGGENSGEF